MKLLSKATIRGAIPFIIITLIAIVFYCLNQDFFIVKSIFINGLIATILAASSVIYDNEKWSLKKQSLIHFSLMLVTVFPLLLISGWYPLQNPKDFFTVFAIFLDRKSVV